LVGIADGIGVKGVTVGVGDAVRAGVGDAVGDGARNSDD
jgi:hypothetical protein